MKMMPLCFLALSLTFSLPALSARNPNCLFGEDLDEMESNPRFSIQSDVIRTFKVPRIEHHKDLVMVIVDALTDKVTGRVYHVNTTFRHTDDGDNTGGWIEEVTGAAENDGGVKNEGAVVAGIGDSEIYRCTVNK